MRPVPNERCELGKGGKDPSSCNKPLFALLSESEKRLDTTHFLSPIFSYFISVSRYLFYPF